MWKSPVLVEESCPWESALICRHISNKSFEAGVSRQKRPFPRLLRENGFLWRARLHFCWNLFPSQQQNKEEEALPTIIYSRQETLYFDASLLRFDDLFEPIRSAYNAASGSTLCPPQYSLLAGEHSAPGERRVSRSVRRLPGSLWHDRGARLGARLAPPVDSVQRWRCVDVGPLHTRHLDVATRRRKRERHTGQHEHAGHQLVARWLGRRLERRRCARAAPATAAACQQCSASIRQCTWCRWWGCGCGWGWDGTRFVSTQGVRVRREQHAHDAHRAAHRNWVLSRRCQYIWMIRCLIDWKNTIVIKRR